jgi:serine/threonine protein kinase
MSSVTGPYHPEYQDRLPLPLAQLYARAYSAKDPRTRHDNSFYLFEAMVKLAAAPLVACYLAEAEAGAPHVAGLDRLLNHLALPSLGHWVGILRQLARHFGMRPDSAGHPAGKLWEQLSRRRQDLPCLLALFRRINHGPDAEPGTDEACSILLALEALVRYRDEVFGQGGVQFESFFATDMGPLLFPAVDELLGEGVLDVLGPPGSRLVCLAELRVISDRQVAVQLRELAGVSRARPVLLLMERDEGKSLAPNVVAVQWPGRTLPLRLDPFLVYRESDFAEEVLFLNRDRSARQVEYLSYTTGHTERNADTATAVAALLGRITGTAFIDEGKTRAMAEPTVARSTAVEGTVGQFSATPIAPRVLGDFELVAEIGRGGMGVVYLARQLSLGRLVALKTLPGDLIGDELALLRFRREMRVLARCDHRNIVKVLSSGAMPDGRLFYAMEYVSGCDLEQVWRELSTGRHAPGGPASDLTDAAFIRAVVTATRYKREQTSDSRVDAPSPSGTAGPDTPPLPLPPLPEIPLTSGNPGGYVRKVVSLMRDAALGLQAVHEQQVVHRDIKPGNLMLTADGSRIILMDFGLAKAKNVDRSVTSAGGMVGTLRYMAPEQMGATSETVLPSADVRGLGVVLWELLARRRLFAEAADEFLLVSLVRERDVPRLRTIDRSIDRDLEAIVARATERHAADRIATASQLAQYLQLWLDGKALPIRSPSPVRRFMRWLRRGHTEQL